MNSIAPPYGNAGKPLLWLHLWVENKKTMKRGGSFNYGREIGPNDWVDFGGLGQFSTNRYFGANSGIYELILCSKDLLLEAYSRNTRLAFATFKRSYLQVIPVDHHF